MRNKLFCNLCSYLVRVLLPAFAVTALALLCICPVGCKSTEDGLIFVEGDFELPKIKSFMVLDEKTVAVDFTKAVDMSEASVCIPGENSFEAVESDFSVEENRSRVLITLRDEMLIGTKYQLDGIVIDKNGNALAFSIPFTGFNAHVPVLLMNEIRNAAGKVTVDGVEHRAAEFVELVALTAGNLSGLRLYSVNDGNKTAYDFPAVEVKAGEYITVHLRKIPEASLAAGEVLVSETENDLALSKSYDSCDSARDLWSQSESACIGSSDILILENTYDGTIIDAFLMSINGVNIEEKFPEQYTKVIQSGVWQGPAFDASNVTSSAVTRSISRQRLPVIMEDEVFSSAEDFLLTANKGSGKNKIIGVTPGYVNSSNPYVSSSKGK